MNAKDVNGEVLQVGDMVAVVRGHACDLGLIYEISSIEYHDMAARTCEQCGEKEMHFCVTIVFKNLKNKDGLPFGNMAEHVQKIRPLTRPTTTTTERRETIKA